MARQVLGSPVTVAPNALALACSASTAMLVGGGEMDAEHARLGPLAQRHDVMLGAVGAQMDGVAFG